ncbi:MAG: DUF1583 domain-containing protein [Planctomycetes bacterium]|nr:DUF1583 domain-containing protein [Planctomycetota bacterium]
MKLRLSIVVMILSLLCANRVCIAQAEFLRNLFGGRAPVRAGQSFQGHADLNQAVAAAANHELAKSLKLIAAAFQNGGPSEPLGGPENESVATQLLQVSQQWDSQQADPADIAAVLLDVVLPSKSPGIVRPYTSRWQLSSDGQMLFRSNARLPVPNSIGAELVRWSVQAKQPDELKKRLLAIVANAPDPESAVEKNVSPRNSVAPATTRLDVTMARVMILQLAIAQQDLKAANETLKALDKETAEATGPLLEYLCHAVSGALRDRNTEEAGLRLLEGILNRGEQSLPPESGLRSNACWLRAQAARIHAHSGRVDAAKRLALSAISNPQVFRRFGEDYGGYLEFSLRQQAAHALLTAGLIGEGLDLAVVPLSTRSARYGRSDIAVNIAFETGCALQKLTPGPRYETLRTFVLPGADRPDVRSIVDLVPNDQPLQVGSGLLLDVYSTNRDLIATARELGKLDELIEELSAIKPQVPTVESLRTLALVMRDGSANTPRPGATRSASPNEVSNRLQTLVAATKAVTPEWGTVDKPEPSLETYVIASEAALHPEWRELAEQLLRHLLNHSHIAQSSRLRDHFRLAVTELLRLRATGGPATVLYSREMADQRAEPASPKHLDWLKLRPKSWDSLGFETANERMRGGLSPTWIAYEGYLSHLSTGRESDLAFAFPLTGTFELSAECREGGWTEGKVGYGGTACSIMAHVDSVYLYGKGQSGAEAAPKMPNLLNKRPWNRHTIRVKDGTVQYYVAGQPVFEDQPGSAAPWLTLGGTAGWVPSYRNLRISGSPTIPREVRLLDDHRLRGWIASYFGESQPNSIRNRRYLRVKVVQNGSTSYYIAEDDGTVEGEPVEMGQGSTDWMLADGELRSAQRSDFWAGSSPSWLSYQRPLREGETLSYDFFYQPGKTDAQPTFGETVYAICPAVGAVDRDEDLLARHACNTDSLKEGWNSITMSLRAGEFRLDLNGHTVVTEQVSPLHSRRIGIYHDSARGDLRVRDVVLTGDWPKAFDATVRAAIESPEPTAPVSNTRFLLQSPPYVYSEEVMSDNAYEIFRQAVKLETPQRYQFLHRWVLPNGAHDLLRTAGALTPTHPAPPVLESNPIDVATEQARRAVDERLVQTGGNFVCPAILLVLAAAELDRLPELRKEIDTLDPSQSHELARGRAAMLGIIALFEDVPEEAVLRIRECQALVLLNKGAPMEARWGEAALASMAIQHPLTREAAFELLNFIKNNQLQANNAGAPEFALFLRQLHGQCAYLMHGGAPEEFGTQPKTKQWRTVSLPRAITRGTGTPIVSFDIIAGEMAERGGHDFDGAYFQSPLRGNYEVRCRLSHFDFREAILMGAGIANALKYTHNETKLSHVRADRKELPIAAPVTPKVYQWHDYKIVVKDGKYTSFVNGQKLYEEELTPDHDPWLAVVGWSGYSSRAVRDIVITGSPVIPDELNLLGSADLIGWSADYYAAELNDRPFEWKLENDELTAPQNLTYNSARSHLKVEDIIRYHRPMLEDGEISYEFYYDPETKLTPVVSNNQPTFIRQNATLRKVRGTTLVHPALDRMVCLIDPKGIKIHWLTDGHWDRTGLMADNVEEVASAGSGGSRPSMPLPLKAGDWNTIKFATKGDLLTIELNGEAVFAREIEPTNLRQFGLFHYANESDVRVRNIRYRGDWPKKLPSVKDQDLAGGPQKLAALAEAAKLADEMKWDFTRSKFNRDEFHFLWGASPDKQIKPSDGGLRFVQPAGETKQQFAGIAPKIQLTGDFIATIEYEGLKTVAAQEQWGSGLSLRAALNGSYTTGFEVRHEAKSTSKVTRAILSMYLPNRPNLFESEAISEFAAAGRLRLQRHGPTLYYLMADPGSEKFRLLTQRPLGTADIRLLEIMADSSDKVSGSEFTLKSLSIRADKITKMK